jgi:hypothetical protein
MMLHFCYRDIELLTHDGRNGPQHLTLVFQRPACRKEELVSTDADEHGPRKALPGHLSNLEGLYDIAFLDVLEALETYSTLKAGGDLANVVLEALQG